jgi:hypothetical protein
MAYVKIKCIKTGTHLQQVIDYIQKPEKTDGNVLVSSFMCSTKKTAKYFEEVSKNARHSGNNIAHHICQSFSPEDNISPQQALEIGQELMKRVYPNHQYVIATHIDRGHIHNHIVVNAVNFENYKKIHSNADNLNQLRQVSDNLCEENGLSVIEIGSEAHRKRLKKMVDIAAENSNNFDEFLGFMQHKGYEIKRGKYLYFKGNSDRIFLNTKVLGTAYTEKNLRARIDNCIEVKNHKVHIYDDKIVKMSHRKRLKFTIEDALKVADDYEDFLRIMRSEQYEVKFGKHLAFKHITGERFIRSESIGFEYTEKMLKLFFHNSEEYQRLKNNYIERLSAPSQAYNRYYAIQDVNIEISMLNYLNENGIKSYTELLSNLQKCQKQVDIKTQNINDIKTQISEKRELIKAVRMYWQYKPIFTKFHSINASQEREAYLTIYKTQLGRYTTSLETLNRAKALYDTLPKANELKAEIEHLENIKERIALQREKLYREVEIYNNLKANLEKISQATDISNKRKIENNLVK